MGIVLALFLVRRRSFAVETVAAIQVQGNTATPDADVLRMAGVSVGMPFEATTIDAVTKRLRNAGKFDSVEVRKRFASLSDLSQIALVIVVDEGRGEDRHDRRSVEPDESRPPQAADDHAVADPQL